MSPRALLLALLVCAAAGCRTSPIGLDERPDFVTPDDLRPVVLLSGHPKGIGSGLIVGEDLVLTAWHVMEEFVAEDGRAHFGLGSLWVEGELVARGEDGADWALVRVRGAHWEPARRVALPPELDATWRPAPGTELWLAGYPAGLYVDRTVDPREPARVIRAVAAAPLDEPEGTWPARGRGLDLGGMSGGGAFVWSAERERLELVGVLIAQTEAVTRLEGPLGIALVLARDMRIKMQALPAPVIALLRGE